MNDHVRLCFFHRAPNFVSLESIGDQRRAPAAEIPATLVFDRVMPVT
jgi:hypothetical protein